MPNLQMADMLHRASNGISPQTSGREEAALPGRIKCRWPQVTCMYGDTPVQGCASSLPLLRFALKQDLELFAVLVSILEVSHSLLMSCMGVQCL
jgi:hypothetical protein